MELPTQRLHGRVLVVDDDAVNRLLLRRRLEHEGLEVEVAEDGSRALAALRSGRFDLMLLDIVMPVLDGYGVLAAVREDPATALLPVIVISGSEEDRAVLRCIEMGADDVLPKPFDPALLRARIGAGLARARLHALEREYREQVSRLTEAAAAVERGDFTPSDLAGVAERDDPLGLLARVLTRMAAEVADREQRLRRQVGELRIEIDQVRAARRVEEIAGTDYFASLAARAADLRASTKAAPTPTPSPVPRSDP